MGDRDANAVQVNVRARPFSAREAAENAEHCVTFFCKTNQIKLGDKLFAFDNVFPPESSQDEVFEDSAAPLLEKFLAGYNCTMLAYGQTGAGKTFTMGTEETKESLRKDTRGIIPRIADKLFERIGESSHSCSWEVSVSMLEVYQEDIVDLLNANKDPLNIREHKGIVFVQGLSSNKVMSLEETMAELEKGCLARSKGSTAMNATSSRSHAIFTINLSKSALSDEECGFTAKFHLVDLAGSERLKKTQAEGERKKEGIKINEGLLALGNVISALSDGLKHIPYRDSKITRILQDSLGGNSCTVMVACISPADTNAEETLSTLRYADRAKKIKNKAVVNVDPQETMLKELKEEILRLRQENAALRTGSGTSVSTDVASGAFSAVAEAGEAANDVRKKCEEVENKLLETAAQKILLTSQLFKAEEAYERLLRNVRTAVESEAASDAKVESLAKLVHAQMLVPVGAGVDDTLSGDERMEIDEVDEHDQTFPERFVKLQEELEKEMERVNQQIKLKEKQFLDNTRNEEQFEKLRETHMKDVAQLQERISAIQAERDQLAEQLKRAGNSNKIAEDRRKRLQELEKELSSNKKRLQEMRKLEQYKAHAQETAKLMRSEIDVLKQARVRMMKQLKQESDKYRVWKSKHERQIQIMKSKERKLELEAARTKQSLGLQLEVFRRKYQESVACNKRLQQQLLHTPSVRSAGGGEKIDELKKIVEDELTLVRTTYEAHVNTNAMLEQRKALSKKLSTAKARRNRLCSEPPTKRRLTGDESKGEVDDEAALKTVEEEIGELEKEINLCSEQIRALQTDTSSVDLDARCDTFCAQMTSQWGKQACRILLEAAMAECRQTAEKSKALEEHEAELRDLRRQIDEERKQEDVRWDTLRSEMLQTKQEASSILVTSSTEVAGLLQMALSNCAMSHQQYSSIEQWIDELTSTKDHIERMEHESEQQDQKRRTLRRTGVRLPRSTSATQIGQKTLLRDEREARSKKVDRFGDGLDPDSSAVLRATGLNLKRHKSKRIPSPILRSPPRTLEFDEKENAPVDQRNTTFVRDDADATFLLDKSLLGVQKPSGVANLGPMSSQK